MNTFLEVKWNLKYWRQSRSYIFLRQTVLTKKILEHVYKLLQKKNGVLKYPLIIISSDDNNASFNPTFVF